MPRLDNLSEPGPVTGEEEVAAWQNGVAVNLTVDSILDGAAYADPDTVISDTYSLQASDNGKTKIFNRVGGCVITVPNGLPMAFNCNCLRATVGEVSFTAPGSLSSSAGATPTIAVNYGIVTIFRSASNTYIAVGAVGVTQLSADLKFTATAFGPVLTSPNATQFRIVVSNAGALSTTQI